MSPDVRKYRTILTKLFMKMPYSNPMRDPSIDLTLLLDSQTKEIFRYQSNLNPETKKYSKSFKLNEEYVQIEKSFAEKDAVTDRERNEKPLVNNMYPKGSSLEIRLDLIDCEIAICSLDLLDIFTDNFDKANLKDGFINWMQESEVLEDRTRAFEVMDQNAYFGRIFNPRTYAVVSNDVICRRVYPLVIDKMAIDPLSNYLMKMPNIYIEKHA